MRKQMIVRMEIELADRLFAASCKTTRTMTDLVVDAITEYLDKPQPRATRKKA